MILNFDNIEIFKDLSKIFDIIHQNEGKVRIVGGAVRDLIINRKVHDIDLASDLLPEKIIKIMRNNNIKVIETGIEFGTVTIILNKKPYQITTLRKDIETDGRHAKVDYTNDWQEDASRRDFTFNAIYLDEDGKTYDYFNGIEDLKNNYIKFIGNPEKRILEDVLRILRAYRFQVQLSNDKNFFVFDKDSEKACEKLSYLIPNLSAERIWQELKQILNYKTSFKIWKRMEEKNITKYIIPKAKDLLDLYSFGKCNYICALSSMIDEEDIKEVSKNLKISRKEYNQIKSIHDIISKLEADLTKNNLSKQLYLHKKENVIFALTILKARKYLIPDNFYNFIESWKTPIFLLKGKDLKEIGMESGIQMGVVLKEVENWWQERKYKPNIEDCILKAKEILEKK